MHYKNDDERFKKSIRELYNATKDELKEFLGEKFNRPIKSTVSYVSLL